MKLVVLSACFLITQLSFAHAESVQDTLEMQARFKKVYENYVFPSPEIIFDDAEERSKFYAGIKNGECGTALVQLALNFWARFPDMPDPTDFKSGGFGAWHYIIAPRDYPELLFCRAMKDVELYDREIKTGKISKSLRFRQFETSQDTTISRPSPLVGRVQAIGDLLRLAMFNYAPAQVALAKLSEKGEAVRLTPAYAYYLLSRAKRSGYKASDLAPLLEKASAALSEEERERLAPRIEKGAWPNTERRVLD